MQVIVEFKSISKKFGERYANKDISFQMFQGHIHGIIGENGAGKSTIMKMLFGMYTPDEGEIILKGQAVKIKTPLKAMRLKIGMVHQHFMLSEHHTALENILLIENQQNPITVFKDQQKIEKIKSNAEKYNLLIDWDKKVKDLSVGMQQRIEILKLLSLDHDILIFDEPTAVLTPQETQELLAQMLTLKSHGKTVVFISHKLKEIHQVCDRITIFKKGSCVGTWSKEDLNIASMSELMVGHVVSNHKRPIQLALKNNNLLTLKNIAFKFAHKDYCFNLQLKAGEIVGIAGIEGHGQELLTRFLFNPTFAKLNHSQPQYTWNEHSLLQLKTEQIRTYPFGIFPADRFKNGMATSLTAYENFILGYQKQTQWQKFRGFLNWKKIQNTASTYLKNFRLEPQTVDLAIEHYSGGNQQKIVVGRELFHQPQFLIASHPTRGVDIGAIEIIHEHLIQKQEQGCAILLISSELEELMKLSDRIHVLRHGQLIKEFQRQDFDEKEIGALMLGSKK